MSELGMNAFWDARAQEDALFFIDTRHGYRNGDLESFWKGGEESLERILGLLDVAVEAGDTALDVGCGVGRLTRVLAGRAREVYALDVSSEMLKRARELNPGLDNVNWVQGDGHGLAPIGDASIDACIAHVVFQHIPDPNVTLGYVKEIGRVLKPGGWAAFEVSNDPAAHVRPALRRRVSRRLSSPVGRRPKGQDDPAWLGAAVALDGLAAVAVDSGLALERILGEGTLFCLVLARRGSSPA
jgi:SAM-dependent methyltransferase